MGCGSVQASHSASVTASPRSRGRSDSCGRYTIPCRSENAPMLEVAEALAEVLARVRPREPAVTPLSPAVLGRVLAEDARANADSPPFPKSLRDGYAVRAADCATPQAALTVVAEIAAGAVPARQV